MDQPVSLEQLQHAPPLQGLPTTIEAALLHSTEARIITEPTDPFRIVHVNDVWCHTCGFDAEEVLGQTCAILHGPGTCRATLSMLRQALLLKRNFAVQLLNYSKEGRPFMNTLQVGPLVNKAGEVTHYLGVVIARFLDGGGAVAPSVQQSGHPAPTHTLLSQPSPPPGNADSSRSSTSSTSNAGNLDHSQSADSLGAAGRVPPFLTKLTEILTAEPANVVNVNYEAASFRIVDPAKFSKEVLPRYFKHNKLGSFSQQLHTYGFRRRAASSAQDVSIEFYHDQYAGEDTDFLAWIRNGGAVSKRTGPIRGDLTLSSNSGCGGGNAPPPQLLQDMIHVQEHMWRLQLMFQQAKATHASQLRTILMKLTLRGLIAPDGASYISALPPVTPMFPPSTTPPAAYASRFGCGNNLGNLGLDPSISRNYSGFNYDRQLTTLEPASRGIAQPGLHPGATPGNRLPAFDGLQAQLDALEAGLQPLQSQPFPMNESNGLDEDLQLFVDNARVEQ